MFAEETIPDVDVQSTRELEAEFSPAPFMIISHRQRRESSIEGDCAENEGLRRLRGNVVSPRLATMQLFAPSWRGDDARQVTEQPKSMFDRRGQKEGA